MRTVKTRGRPALLTAGLLLALAVAAGTAVAGHFTGGVASYTGCISSGGTLSLISEGDVPQKPCPPGALEAHFSGGDITEISGGAGVQVTSGDNGKATIALDTSYSLPQGCS